MARPGLMIHPKFKVLTRKLGLSRAHVRGHLELLWEVAYESGNPVIGDAESVAAAAEFDGDTAQFIDALTTCGGDGHAGFVECVPGEPGRFQIHDLFDNAPDYVRKRKLRHDQRRDRRSAPNGGQRRTMAAVVRSLTAEKSNPAVLPTPNTQHPTPNPEGGLGGGEGFVPALEMAMLLYGPMLETSEIIRTEHGEPMGWPTANDTGNKGRQIGEAAAVASTPDPAFGKVRWNAYKYTSDELLVPYELLEDGAFDLAPKLGDMCGERLGRILNEKATIGTGAATMKGIVPASTQGKETASASAITADEILDLIHSVGRAYRVGAGFMFNDATCLVLRKLKDGEGRYLWQQGLSGGAPDTLATYPVHINDDMASIAAVAKVMLFGQLSKYKIRQVGSMRLYRLVERHRENDEDAFLSFIRADGNLLDAGVAPVKHLVMHA